MTKSAARKILRDMSNTYRAVRHLPNCNEIMQEVYARTPGFQEANAMALCDEAA